VKLLLLVYGALCVLVFKVFRVPANKWTVTTAALGGGVIVGGFYLLLAYNHPATNDARLYFYTTPIIPQVKGRVVEVLVKPNVPLKSGDPLFRIDPKPYQFVVDQKKAALAEAEQNVRQISASLDQARAVVEKAKAQLGLAQETHDRQQQLFDRQVTAQAARDTARRNLEAALQAVAEAQAAEQRVRLALTSEIGGVNTTVARLAADLSDAEYNLEQTTVTAPTDGYLAQLFLRPGMMAASAPAAIFIHAGDRTLSAAFKQNVAQRLRPGFDAEIAFDTIPGRVFKGKVTVLVNAISQGQLQASGTLLDPEDRLKSPGFISANIAIIDDMSAWQLPAGTTAQVAVYSDRWRVLAIARRVILRMQSWMNYVT
jgi:multidrug resistance efflux pump